MRDLSSTASPEPAPAPVPGEGRVAAAGRVPAMAPAGDAAADDGEVTGQR